MPNIEHLPGFAFRLMSFVMVLQDFFKPGTDRRVATFGIRENMTVVDYGCGPGRYAVRFAKLTGKNGKVYALDVHPLAIQAVRRKMEREGLSNILPVLAEGYHSAIPDRCADLVVALDLFFGVADPSAFLAEIHRITKTDGFLIIDDGHQPRKTTLEKIKASGKWEIIVDAADHLKCRPIHPFSGLPW